METEAIVLDIVDHGESDLIVTLFSRHFGKVSAIAKGARKSLKRFVNKLELFSLLHIVCTRKPHRELAFLAEAELQASYIHLRLDFQRYAIASVLREFLLLGIKEEQADDRLFRISLWALHHLDLGLPPQAILIHFLLRFFDYLGYRPDVEICSSCGIREITANDHAFNPSGGKLCCRYGGQTPAKMIAISPGTIRMMRMAQDHPLDKLHRLRISGTIRQESLLLLHAFGRELFQRDFIAWKTMNRFL